MKSKLTFVEKFDAHLSAAYPILVIETHEEQRALGIVRDISRNRMSNKSEAPEPPIYAEWDIAKGMTVIDLKTMTENSVAESISPERALSIVERNTSGGIFVMKDLHPVFKSPQGVATFIRRLRNLIPEMKMKPKRTLILISPQFEVPLDLKKDVTVLDFELPTEAELAAQFVQFVDESLRSDDRYRSIKCTPKIAAAVGAAATGMTTIEADGALALCAVRMSREHPDKKVVLNTDFPRIVFEQKIATLKGGFLEYQQTFGGFERIGGLEPIKEWALERRKGFEPAARALNLPNPKGALIAGFQGCVDGNAELLLQRAGKSFKITLEKAYLRFNGLDRREKNNWTKSIPTKCRALCDGVFQQHTVDAIIDKGVKPVLKIILQSGKSLRLTHDHEVAMNDGSWKRADLLVVGDKVLTNGTPRCACGSTKNVATYKYSKFLGSCRKCINRKLKGQTVRKSGKTIDKDGYVLVSGQFEHPRADANNCVFEHILVMEKKLGRFLKSSEKVHHKNETPGDNSPANLEVVTESQHNKLHRRCKNLHGGVTKNGGKVCYVPKPDVVVSVDPDGTTQVYDIVMSDPYRNFVANGIVVHNCGKTTTAMAIANVFEFPFFKLNLGTLFGSLVGSSEANVRELIRLLNGIGRAVVLMDEMEKFLNEGATSGSGDSGASSRVFGTLLSWMAEKTCPVFLLATVNKIDVLPPALTRRGRFDCVFWVDLPSDSERVSIFNALLEYKFKRAFRVSDVNHPLIVKSADFSGAEIESAIEDALYSMLGNNLPESKFEAVLLRKVTDLMPQARIDPSHVQAMRQRAKNGFIIANRANQTDKLVTVGSGRDIG